MLVSNYFISYKNKNFQHQLSTIYFFKSLLQNFLYLNFELKPFFAQQIKRKNHKKFQKIVKRARYLGYLPYSTKFTVLI